MFHWVSPTTGKIAFLLTYTVFESQNKCKQLMYRCDIFVILRNQSYCWSFSQRPIQAHLVLIFLYLFLMRLHGLSFLDHLAVSWERSSMEQGPIREINGAEVDFLVPGVICCYQKGDTCYGHSWLGRFFCCMSVSLSLGSHGE